MKRVFSISAIILLSLGLIFTFDSCKDGDVSGSIKAYISDGKDCPQGPVSHNFTGDHVYAYFADDLFGVPTIQAGGYESGDARELGVNIFEFDYDDFEDGNGYWVSGGSDIDGTGYIFYIPDTDALEQYISAEGQEVAIELVTIEYTDPDPDTGEQDVSRIVIRVASDVKMVSFETGDTICITNIEFEVKAN